MSAGFAQTNRAVAPQQMAPQATNLSQTDTILSEVKQETKKRRAFTNAVFSVVMRHLAQVPAASQSQLVQAARKNIDDANARLHNTIMQTLLTNQVIDANGQYRFGSSSGFTMRNFNDNPVLIVLYMNYLAYHIPPKATYFEFGRKVSLEVLGIGAGGSISIDNVGWNFNALSRLTITDVKAHLTEIKHHRRQLLRKGKGHQQDPMNAIKRQIPELDFDGALRCVNQTIKQTFDLYNNMRSSLRQAIQLTASALYHGVMFNTTGKIDVTKQISNIELGLYQTNLQSASQILLLIAGNEPTYLAVLRAMNAYMTSSQ